MLFILSLNFTDQGIRNIKESPKRAKVARELAKKMGVEIKQVYLTSGASDLVVLAETENGDNIAKLALAIGSQGNVRTRTARAWTEEEYQKARFRIALGSRCLDRPMSRPYLPCADRQTPIRFSPCPQSFAHATQAPELAGAFR